MPAAGTTLMNLCFTRLKTPLPFPQSLNTSQSPSSDDDDDQTNHSRPLPNPSSLTAMMMINSLYHSETTTTIDRTLTRSYSWRSDPDFTTSDVEPDFATIYASQRFFVTSPGRSNSIIESTPSISNDDRSISDHDSSQSTPYVKDSVAVSTYSPDPYVDFRQSMQEMVEARDMHVIDGKANSDYLHELLLCYLTLNPKSTHKFIIGAFVDLLVSLRPPPAATGGGCNS